MRVLIPILLAALTAGCIRSEGRVHIDDVGRAQELCYPRQGLRTVKAVRWGVPTAGDQSVDIQIEATCTDGSIVSKTFRQAPAELAREGS